MVKALLSILNVVEGEERPVLMLLGYGFFMGVFLAAYKIVATTLFLNQLSEYIREAFFVSGLLGLISTWLYATLQNRVHYSKLIIFNIILLTPHAEHHVHCRQFAQPFRSGLSIDRRQEIGTILANLQL